MKKSQGLADNQFRILEALKKSPKGFETLKRELQISRPVLSKHLKHLQLIGLVRRDPATRRYEDERITEETGIDLAMWKSTDLLKVREAARLVDRILDSGLPREDKLDLLRRFLEASFQYMAANIVLNVSWAGRKKEMEEVLASIHVLIDGYVKPYLQFIALSVWIHSPLSTTWLELIGSSIAHEASHQFDIAEALEALKPEEKGGSQTA